MKNIEKKTVVVVMQTHIIHKQTYKMRITVNNDKMKKKTEINK